MTQPDTAFSDLPDDDGKTTDSEGTQTFEQQVNTAVEAMTQDDKGVWVVPEGLSDEVKYTTTLEKRRRDAQAALGKADSRTASLEATVDTLKQRAIENVQLNLTVEQKEELADLKASDPDAWKAKLDGYEQDAMANVAEELSTLGHTGEAAVEEATRVQQLQKCLDDNPGLVLDDSVFENDLPPRLTKKLENGDCSFGEFLVEAVKVLKPGTKVKIPDDVNEPNLGAAGGGSGASDTSITEDSLTSYRKEVY